MKPLRRVPVRGRIIDQGAVPALTNWQDIHRQVSQGKVLQMHWTCCRVDHGAYSSSFSQNMGSRKVGIRAGALQKVGPDPPPAADLKTLKNQLQLARQNAHAYSQKDSKHTYAVILSSCSSTWADTVRGLDSVWQKGIKTKKGNS